MSKHSNSTAAAQAINKRGRVERWLMQEGWKISEGHHPKASWVIGATSDAGFSLMIIQPSSMQDRIDIQANSTISPDHQKLLGAMDAKQRQDLWWNLRFDLAKMGVDFNFIGEPVQMIAVSQRMYDDGLTKDRFVQRIAKIRNAQFLILGKVRRVFDQPPNDEILDSGFVQ